MPTFAGQVLLADRVEDGWMQVEQGRVADAELGNDLPEKPVARGWIVPAPVNAHTHAADTFLRGRPGMPTTVADLVGPGGWKHRHLQQASAEDLVAGFDRLAQEMAAKGTSTFVDFREGGAEGARLLRQASQDLPAEAVVMGRPLSRLFDGEEAQLLFEAADGIGLSGLRDLPAATFDAWADACRRQRRSLAFHASEDRRDDAGRIVALAPAFVVHMNQGKAADFDELAQSRIPVAVCPRSNRFFGYRTPVPAMLEAGLELAVGTDNGMLQDGDVLAELGQLRQWFPELGVDTLLRMATFGGRRLLGRPAPRFPRPGDVADWVVLPPDPLPAAPSTKPSISPAPHSGQPR